MEEVATDFDRFVVRDGKMEARSNRKTEFRTVGLGAEDLPHCSWRFAHFFVLSWFIS